MKDERWENEQRGQEDIPVSYTHLLAQKLIKIKKNFHKMGTTSLKTKYFKIILWGASMVGIHISSQSAYKWYSKLNLWSQVYILME